MSGELGPGAPGAGVGPAPPVGGGKPLTPAQVLESLRGRFGDGVRAGGLPGRAPHAVVERAHLREALAFLRDDPALRFDFLVDVTAVDYLLLELPELGERYAVVYQLLSLFHGHRFVVKTPVPEDDPRVPTASDLWRSARWGERETHDMFGIGFEGHSDLRRLLMPENYPGFPLRKDYPLRGRGERDSFPQHRPGGPPAQARDQEAPRPVQPARPGVSPAGGR